MGHRINEWVQRLLVPCLAIAAITFTKFGFNIGKTLAILLTIFSVIMLFIIAIDPGPRTKGIVDSLRDRLRL
jgi:hypothetical protein